MTTTLRPPPRDPLRERGIIAGSAAGVAVLAVVLLALAGALGRDTDGGPAVPSAAAPTSSTTAPPRPSAEPATTAVAPTTVGQRTTFSIGQEATQALALSADGSTLLVGTYAQAINGGSVGPSNVAVVDVTTGALRTTIPTSRGLLELAVSADGTRAWATASVDNVVDVIDVRAGAVAARVATGDFPQGIALSPDGRTVWVGHYDDGTLVALDAASGTVRSNTSLGDDVTEVAASADGRTVVAADQGGIAIVDTTTSARRDVRLAEDDSPTALEISPDGRLAYVGVGRVRQQAVQVVDLTSGRITGSGAVNDVVFDLVADANGLLGTTSSTGSNGTGSLLTFRPGSPALLAQQPIGYDPSSLVLSRDGSLVYAVDGDEKVSIVRVR